MTTIILHTIAAVIWFLALVFAAGFGSIYEENPSKKTAWGGAFLCGVISIIAFTLQVIA